VLLLLLLLHCLLSLNALQVWHGAAGCCHCLGRSAGDHPHADGQLLLLLLLRK
jgi:hypothetical protein